MTLVEAHPFPNETDAGRSFAPRLAGAAAPRHQRAGGHVRILFRRRGAATALHRLFQEGSAKARFPRIGGAVPEAVLINTAGGLTGGDRFRYEVELAENTRATVTTQACERIYRSAGGEAEVATRLTLGAGARLDWLPQETILFDGGCLRRTLDAELAEGAALLVVESVVFGRLARGERVRSGLFRDRWRVRQAGRLVFADDLRFGGDVAAVLARPAVLAGNAAMATALLVAPDSERKLDAVRQALGNSGGASGWGGKLVLRVVAADGFALRAALLPALTMLADGRQLPRVWQS